MMALTRRLSFAPQPARAFRDRRNIPGGETRARREFALLRDRFGVADERNGLWRLRFIPEWLDAKQLPSDSQVVDETPSAADLARDAPMFSPVFAEFQTRGRGRRGRRWLSVPAGAILFAVRVPAPKSPLGLPLAVGVAALRALQCDGGDGEVSGDGKESNDGEVSGGQKSTPVPNLKLKWPNDILDGRGRKVAGVLAEMFGASVVVGVGANILMTSRLRAALRRPVAGLLPDDDLRSPQFRNLRAKALAESVCKAADDFARDGAEKFLPQALATHFAAPGESVSFHASDGEVCGGEFVGFGPKGELLLRRNGTTESHISGEFADPNPSCQSGTVS